MKLNSKFIKNLANAIGFKPEDGKEDVYYKIYNHYNNYIIRIDFNNEKIEYRNDQILEEEGIKWGDKTTSNFVNSENFVVLECVNRLLEKGYLPKSITLEKKYPLGRELKGKLDIVVSDSEEKPFLMIECKTYDTEYEKELKKMIKDGGQLFSYFVKDKATKYLCLYTSKLEKDIIEYKNDIIPVDKAWLELTNDKEIHDHWNKNFKDNGIFDEWSNAYDIEIKALVRSRLKPLVKEVSDKIYHQFLEILRHNVVSDKPNAFNKMLNLFICKIIDEDRNDNEEVKFQWFENDTDKSLQIRLNDLYKEGMNKFLNIEVTDYSNEDLSSKLSDINDKVAIESIREMFINLRLQKNPEFAFIEVYDEQSFILNGRVVREIVELLQPYKFRYGYKQQFLGEFFELLLNTSIKQEAGQFFTPEPIAAFIISSLPIKEIITQKQTGNETDILPNVIDYACGSGHFLTEYMSQVQKIIEKIDITKASPSARKKINTWRGEDAKFEWAKDYVYGLEADYRLVKTAKVSSFLNGDGEANIIRANGLDHFSKSNEYTGKLKEISRDELKDNGEFDILIANPPYSVNAFKSTIKYGIESFELFERLTDKSSEIECLFVERTKQLLKVGGFAGVILPSSILRTTGLYTATREIILKYFKIRAITELGPKTFMATGTSTVVLFLERRANNDHKLITNAVKSFFENPKDKTVLGIEKAFSNYVNEVFDGVTFEDYISFTKKNPTADFIKLEIFEDYKNSFNELTQIKKLKDSKIFKNMEIEAQKQKLDDEFYKITFEIEKEKLIYFLLTFSQQTVIVKVGENQAEKNFIGYEFSTRKGSEGIKLLSSGTKLYDESNPMNPQKANSYIYNSFLGNDIVIEDSMKDNVYNISMVSLIDFEKPYFEKSISLSVKKKLNFKTTIKLVSLIKLVKDIQSGNRPKGGVKNNKKGIVSLGGEHIGLDGRLKLSNLRYVSEEYYNNAFLGKVENNDILLCKDGTLTGKVAMISGKLPFEKIMVNEHIFIIRANELILQKYLFLYLFSENGQINLKSNITGQAQGGLNSTNLKAIKIPLPPLDIQEKIVNQIEEIESNEVLFKKTINNRNLEIVNIMNSIQQYPLLSLSENLVSINDDNICPVDTPEKFFIYVDIESVENGTGVIDFSKKIIGKNAPSRARRIAHSNSTIISTVRPNLKAFAYINNEVVDCIYSTGFAVLKSVANDLLIDKWIYLNFMYSRDLMLQMMSLMPKGQYPSINNTDIRKIKLFIPPLEKQKEIVNKIEKIELEIQLLEDKLLRLEDKKKKVLIKYL